MSFDGFRLISKCELAEFDFLAENNDVGYISSKNLINENEILRFGYFVNSKLTGGICLSIRKIFGISIFVDPPFTPNCGAFINKVDSDRLRNLQIQKKYIEDLTKLISGKGLSFVNMSLPRNIVDVQPLIWANCDVRPNFTYVLKLKNYLNLEDLFSKASKDLQRSIKKGTKLEIKKFDIHRWQEVETFLKELDKNKRIGDIRKIERLLVLSENINTSYESTLFLYDDSIVGLNVMFLAKNTSFLLVNIQDSAFKFVSTNMIKHSIRQALDKDLDYFDFEGSMNVKIERYFRQFGGDLIPYWKIVKGPLWFKYIVRRMQLKNQNA